MEKCKECNKEFKSKNGLSQHIRLVHEGNKKYYDKWMGIKENRFCKIYGNENKFVRSSYGYTNGCCKKHMNILGYDNRKNHLLKNRGVGNPFQLDGIKEKIKQTTFEKYGNKNYRNIEKAKQTYLDKHGVDHNFKDPKIIEKRKQTWLKNWGVDNPFKSKDIQKKIINTNINKFGVYNVMQNDKIFHKAFKTRFSIKKFNNTDLYYQGSYELDFLEKYYEKIKIENANSIDYIFKTKPKKYFPDFFIPIKNLIVEIKSTYTLKLDEEFNDKKLSVLDNGFNYICILDKNYEEFNKIL